jgi:hypothetical protein
MGDKTIGIVALDNSRAARTRIILPLTLGRHPALIHMDVMYASNARSIYLPTPRTSLRLFKFVIHRDVKYAENAGAFFGHIPCSSRSLPENKKAPTILAGALSF